MTKALEILLMDRSDIANHKIVTTEMFNEALAELEEAMKPKTCEGCKHLDGVICKHDRGLYCVRQFEADYFVKDTQC